MKTKDYAQRKTSFQFSEPKKEREFFQARAFANPNVLSSQTEQTPELQTQIDRAKLSGERLSRISISPRTAVQPKLRIDRQADAAQDKQETGIQKIATVERSPIVQPAAIFKVPSELIQRFGGGDLLSEKQIQTAIRYNRKRGYSIETLEKIQQMVGTKVDGIVGPNTVQAIALWQKDREGLVMDGKVGPNTFASMFSPAPETAAPETNDEKANSNQSIPALEEEIPTEETENSSPTKTETPKLEQDPQQIIKNHTKWFNLNEEGLAKYLLKRMPEHSDLVVKVFRTLSRSDRDDVAYYLVENASDDQIKSFAIDAGGRRVLTLILAEFADGWPSKDGEKARDRVLSLLPSDTPQKPDTQIKAEAKEQQKDKAEKLIEAHTSRLNLREEKLAKDLLNRLPNESILAEKVLDLLENRNKDDVSLCLLEAASDGEIKNIAKDVNGRALLLRIVQELYKGDMYDDERKQMQRTMNLISEVDNTGSEGSVEVEVITFLYGGSALDIIGVVAAGGSKGHTAIVVGDLAYSFELGWSCGKTKAEYLAANTNRDGMGQVLNLNKEEAEKVQKKLNASCGKGAYAVSGDICTDSTAIALEGVLKNLQSGWNPQRFVGYLEDTGKVKDRRFYPKKKE